MLVTVSTSMFQKKICFRKSDFGVKIYMKMLSVLDL